MEKDKNVMLKRIINSIFIMCVIVSFIWFFVVLFDSIPLAEKNDDIFGSHGNGFFGIILYGPILVVEYAIYRLIRLFLFSEVIVSKKVKYARNIFLCGSWFLIYFMGLICNCIEIEGRFQQAPFLRDYVYFELAWGMIIVFVPAYVLGFILSKFIKFLYMKE